MVYTKSNPGYTGYPALFFLETLREGKGEQKLSQMMTSLEKRYSYLRAYLPVRYEKNDKSRAEYQEKIAPLLQVLSDEIEAMEQEYNPIFEGDSCSDLEKKFLRCMRGVRERIDEIAATTGIIDKIAMDEEEMNAG